MQFDRIRQFFGTPIVISGTLRDKFSSVTELVFGNLKSTEAKKFRMAFQSLIHPMLLEDGQISEKNKTVYRQLLDESFDARTARAYFDELTGITPLSTAAAAEIINAAAPGKSLQTAEFLIMLAVALGGRPETVAAARDAAEKLGMPEHDFEALLQKSRNEELRKQQLKKSGRGIAAALVVILIFMLTAKYLQSVIFGVLLACILLPLEKFFERRLTARRGIFFLLTLLFSVIFSPLRKLSSILTRKNSGETLPPADETVRQKREIVRQSVILTVLTALALALAAAFGVSKLTGHYMSNLQQSIRLWETARAHTADKETKKPVSRYSYALEKLRENFESLPIVQTGLDYLAKLMKNPEVRDQLTRSALRSSGGILNLTGGVIGWFAALVCDILLAIFFALLFLIKFAEVSSSSAEKRPGASGSEYIVRNFFNGIWLPGADENLLKDTSRIIDGVLSRLRVWLKGYLTLIMVDSSFYTVCFFFLGVPFFLPLGIVAGCGIALPYLGPILSCGLTLLVTIAGGGATGEMLLAIVVCYLIYNGIIEQFILYPAVIGESLGLSTLETIVVVLLGAAFAGIPGMIFALPAASVAKYIIPQIYHGFSLRRNDKGIADADNRIEGR